jgi:hypothetical protein
VLLSFDGIPIANDGTILFRRRERISFEHLVTLKVGLGFARGCCGGFKGDFQIQACSLPRLSSPYLTEC